MLPQVPFLPCYGASLPHDNLDRRMPIWTFQESHLGGRFIVFSVLYELVCKTQYSYWIEIYSNEVVHWNFLSGVVRATIPYTSICFLDGESKKNNNGKMWVGRAVLNKSRANALVKCIHRIITYALLLFF